MATAGPIDLLRGDPDSTRATSSPRMAGRVIRAVAGS